MPQADAIKLLTSHIVAAVLAIGGPILIVWLFLFAPEGKDIAGITALLGGFVGLSVNFLFQTNTSAAVRQQTKNDIYATPPA
jgi:uncharacterized membrane protein